MRLEAIIIQVKNIEPQNKIEKMLTAGQVLKTYRERYGFDLKEISASTKIPLHQLQAIEKDEYGTYESQVFVRGFVRNYAEYLGLDKEKVLAIYRRTAATQFKQYGKKKDRLSTESPAIKSRPKNLREFIENLELTPAKVIGAISLLLIVFIAIYLLTQFYKFQAPPTLQVTTPDSNITVEKDELQIKGLTETNATVKVNDALTTTNAQGEFDTTVKLAPGINTIIIKSYKNNNEERANVITRNITYNKKEETAVQPTTPVAQQKFKVQVYVEKEPAWIMLVLDGKQIIAEIVHVGVTKEYEFKNTLQSSTGKPSTSKLVINGKPQAYIVDTTTHTASLNCQIKDNNLDCTK